MLLLDRLLGRPLPSAEAGEQKVGATIGVAVFGLDALGSTAYGPEAALTMLLPLGAAASYWVVPISFSIILLLAIVAFSYLQTIPAYPGGGGSYQVAGQNLGPSAGLLAASALMIDYLLTVAVGISAGVGALVSAVPKLQPHTLTLGLFLLVLIAIVNLRGLRESGAILAVPTYLFVACMFGVLGWGLWKGLAADGHPVTVARLHPPGAAHRASAWLLLKAFAAGCTAMTGVEAVSNGVSAFTEPRTRTARRTLMLIVGILALLLAAVAWLCRMYQIGATEPGRAGYENVLSQLAGAIAGKGGLYYVTMASILLVLALQADTAFAGFPRLCCILARDQYLPRAFSVRGRRLVYSYGIVLLALLSGGLLILFGGVTDRLIPLFAIGAFLAFTLSQAGMVRHWMREKSQHSGHSAIVNGVGAAATAIALAIIVVSKFSDGAWAALLVIPGLVVLMRSIRAHRLRLSQELTAAEQLPVDCLCPPLVVVPMDAWDKAAQRALRFGMSISQTVFALHIDADNQGREIKRHWTDWVEKPARRHGLRPPELIVVPSPYRVVVQAVVDYVLELQRTNPDGHIAVIVPTVVERRWYRRFLHNQRGELLTALLLLNGQPRISIVNVPWRPHC
uniref:Putative aminoacid/polyamine transporter, permease protein n=1 Tax=Solibacter usitatus (strain Ellin6076) TaxID=234267 RepID=Q022W8_SOLUE